VQAADYFEQALSAAPTHPGAHNNLGFAPRALSRPEEAEDHFRQACALQSGSAEAHYNLGLSLRTLGQTVEAAEQFRITLKLRPTFNQARRALNEIARKR